MNQQLRACLIEVVEVIDSSDEGIIIIDKIHGLSSRYCIGTEPREDIITSRFQYTIYLSHFSAACINSGEEIEECASVFSYISGLLTGFSPPICIEHAGFTLIIINESYTSLSKISSCRASRRGILFMFMVFLRTMAAL